MKIYHWVCVPILALSLIVGCSQDKVIPLGTGLIGAYYGNSDFTNIKDAEILTSLDKVWNEETGHGNTWSGQWEGYLIAPVTGDVTLTLVSNKEASLNLGENISIHTDEESTEASTVISMKKGESYPIKIGYTHAGGGTGTL